MPSNLGNVALKKVRRRRKKLNGKGEQQNTNQEDIEQDLVPEISQLKKRLDKNEFLISEKNRDTQLK